MRKMSERITPKQKSEVIALLEVGFSKSASARQAGVSLSTVKRIAKDPNVKPNKNHAELVARASESLYSALSSDFAKRQLASLIVDDLAIAAGLRDNISALIESVDRMEVTNLKEAGTKARTLAAIATANKLSTDNLRQVISLASPQVEIDELPELVITEMLSGDVDDIRSKQEDEAAAMGIMIDEGETA
jgi:lambda repressor-like predicted transcriptional regulator